MEKALLCTVLTVLIASPASAAQIVGDACNGSAGLTSTVKSDIQTEGIIACIPDVNGNYFWQPENGGMARYDSTASCNTPGAIRWNGTGFQGCYGTQWKSLASGSCHYNYYAREVRGDGNYWHYYGAAAGVWCINNAPDSTWEFVGFDECYEDGDKCTPDGLLCYYAQAVCS